MKAKNADTFLDELLQAVRPPPRVAIVLRERAPHFLDDPNWVTAAGAMPPDALERYTNAITTLRRQQPHIDWEGVTEYSGDWRRISRWLS